MVSGMRRRRFTWEETSQTSAVPLAQGIAGSLFVVSHKKEFRISPAQSSFEFRTVQDPYRLTLERTTRESSWPQENAMRIWIDHDQSKFNVPNISKFELETSKLARSMVRVSTRRL
jgi:hypothetical protein